MNLYLKALQNFYITFYVINKQFPNRMALLNKQAIQAMRSLATSKSRDFLRLVLCLFINSK